VDLYLTSLAIVLKCWCIIVNCILLLFVIGCQEKDDSGDNNSYVGRSRSTSVEKSSSKSRYEPYTTCRPARRSASTSSPISQLSSLAKGSSEGSSFGVAFDTSGSSKDQSGHAGTSNSVNKVSSGVVVKEEPQSEFDTSESNKSSSTSKTNTQESKRHSETQARMEGLHNESLSDNQYAEQDSSTCKYLCVFNVRSSFCSL